MTEREERRFAEVPRESIKLMAESAGVELSEEVAALLAEDVCYRLREATQVIKLYLLSDLPFTRSCTCLCLSVSNVSKILSFYKESSLHVLSHNRTAHSSCDMLKEES